jgi:hypothetical protein
MKLKDINLFDVGNHIQMVGAMYSDGDENYVLLFPEDHGAKVLPQNVLEMDHEEWKAFIRQTDLLEVQPLDGALDKAILRKSARQIEQGVFWNVYRRDGYRCRYCGKDDVPLTVDHVILWHAGGPNIEENLVSSCRKCNKVRGDTPFAEWLRHPFYTQAAEKLTAAIRQANEDLVATLDKIPRVRHIKSR